jgi:hypothetical protein
MRSILFAAAAALALSGGIAFAQGGGGSPAIANQTTTSVGAPPGSPGYKAPRSEAVPGVPPQARAAEEANEGSPAATLAPKNPVTGHVQTSR